MRSQATTLPNFEGGYQLFKSLRVNVNIYNLFDAVVSDIDYYFASRLPGEALAGVDDIHTHPAVPRTLRVSVIAGFMKTDNLAFLSCEAFAPSGPDRLQRLHP